MKKMLICNQKMFLTHDEALMLKNNLDALNIESNDFILCPSYLNFDIFKGYNIGAQNCFYEDTGAYTGEISAYQLHLNGIKYCLLGHLERRNKESLHEINLKIKACFRNSITPVLCIGETKLDKEMRRVYESIKKQLITILKGINLSYAERIIIAYEPEWANDKCIIEKETLEDTILFIKKVLSDLKIENYKLLYGGGITSNNIENVLTDSVDGYLIGSASTDIHEIKEIVKCIK